MGFRLAEGGIGVLSAGEFAGEKRMHSDFEYRLKEAIEQGIRLRYGIALLPIMCLGCKFPSDSERHFGVN